MGDAWPKVLLEWWVCRPRVRLVRLLFEPKYAWVGVCWERDCMNNMRHIHLCLLPFLPLHIALREWPEVPRG